MSKSVRRGVLAAVVLLLVVVAGYVVLGRDSDDDRTGTDEAGQSGAQRAVPPPPDTLASVGSWVDSSVDADGNVEVQQWTRSATPIDRLRLTTADPDAYPGTVESSDVLVRTLDGTRLAARNAVGTRTLTVRLREPATEFYLSYTIAGATLSDETSTVEGRTVARVVGMDVVFDGQDGPTTRVVHYTGGTVLSAACLDPAAGYEAPPTPCGAPTADGGWQAELAGDRRNDRILASLAVS